MKMKQALAVFAMLIASVGMVATPMDADAKRLGGGRPAGMQRQVQPRQPSTPPAQQPVQPAQPAYGNQAATNPGMAPQPAKRSWLGPVAGIAAGLGIAALMSHFGMGAAMGNIVTMILLAVVAMMVFGWVRRRFSGGATAGGPQLAGAGAPYGGASTSSPPSYQREALTPSTAGMTPAAGAAAGNLSQVPAGFDAAGFERVAKMIFIRLQAANDAANIDDLRKFTTPELFASLRLDIQERGPAPNQTDVMQLDAELVDTAKEGDQWVASVRFHGLIREEVNAGAQPFNELWHLVKPVDDSRDWAIAGITPLS